MTVEIDADENFEEELLLKRTERVVNILTMRVKDREVRAKDLLKGIREAEHLAKMSVENMVTSDGCKDGSSPKMKARSELHDLPATMRIGFDVHDRMGEMELRTGRDGNAVQQSKARTTLPKTAVESTDGRQVAEETPEKGNTRRRRRSRRIIDSSDSE